MKRILFTTVASCLLATLPVQASLILNGGFENALTIPDGDPLPGSGWSDLTTDPSITTAPDNVHSGNNAAELGADKDIIRQYVPITHGQTYLIDFWAKGATAGNKLRVRLDGASSPFYLTTEYRHYSLSITVKYDPIMGGDNYFNYFPYLEMFNEYSATVNTAVFIDDVSVTAVPESTTVIAGALLLLPFGVSTLRLLRKNTSRSC